MLIVGCSLLVETEILVSLNWTLVEMRELIGTSGNCVLEMIQFALDCIESQEEASKLSINCILFLYHLTNNQFILSCCQYCMSKFASVGQVEREGGCQGKEI